MLFKPDRIATYLTVCILVVIWNAVNDLHALLKDYKMCDNAKKVNAKKLKKLYQDLRQRNHFLITSLRIE